jgi:D-sedoheptulose 7-phosphate isomerase
MKNHKNIIFDIIKNHKKVIQETNLKDINKIISLLLKVIKKKNTIFWAGNGGSAAECQHMSAELIGRFKINRRPLKSVSLTVDTSAITAISNDFGYEKVFSRQIEGLGTTGDVLIALSTSGNSENIIHVLKTCKKMRIKTIALLGNNGGKCKKYASYNIIINSSNTARIQELHQTLLHYICEILERQLFYK